MTLILKPHAINFDEPIVNLKRKLRHLQLEQSHKLDLMSTYQ
jgi:ABC-type sugar transport system ATPase subunit